jgi:hypothetical protein
MVSIDGLLKAGVFVVLGALSRTVVRAIMGDGSQIAGGRVFDREVAFGTRREVLC